MRGRMDTRRGVACILACLAAGCGGGGETIEIVVESIAPDRGPIAGGQIVRITGRGFLSGGAAPNMALVGDGLAPSVSGVSDVEIELVTPPGDAPGAVDVTIFN